MSETYKRVTVTVEDLVSGETQTVEFPRVTDETFVIDSVYDDPQIDDKDYMVPRYRSGDLLWLDVRLALRAVRENSGDDLAIFKTGATS